MFNKKSTNISTCIFIYSVCKKIQSYKSKSTTNGPLSHQAIPCHGDHLLGVGRETRELQGHRAMPTAGQGAVASPLPRAERALAEALNCGGWLLVGDFEWFGAMKQHETASKQQERQQQQEQEQEHEQQEQEQEEQEEQQEQEEQEEQEPQQLEERYSKCWREILQVYIKFQV